MHIRNADEYEAALEDAVQRMDAGSRGRQADPTLFELLAAIEAYRPTFQAPADVGPGLSSQAEHLVARARDLKRVYEEHTGASWNSLPTDGRGIGPTTGV